MGNIPNTNTPNLVLQSVGNGSNDSRWGTSGGGSTLPTGTGTGQMIWWNGTAWIVTSTTGLTTNYVMTWNGTAWVPTAGGNTLGGYAVNVSALNPTTDTGAMLTFNYNSFTGLSQWVETYVPTGTGSMFFWNGTNWESTSTTGIATGNVLVWNNSTSKWVPGNITLSGEVTGTTSSTSVVKLISYLLPVTGAQMGNFLYYNSTSGKWEYGGARTGGATPSVGDVPVWNATTGWTAGPVSSTPSLSGNPTGSMFQNTSTNVTNTIALVQNMASNFVNGSVTFNGSGGSYPYSLRVPTTGYYQVDGQVYIAAGTATGGYVISLIYVNGSEVMRANSYGTGGAAPHCGGVIALNANDYVQLYAQVQSGTAATSVVSGSLRTFVSLSLVSQ